MRKWVPGGDRARQNAGGLRDGTPVGAEREIPVPRGPAEVHPRELPGAARHGLEARLKEARDQSGIYDPGGASEESVCIYA